MLNAVDKLVLIDKFCYLGDTLGNGGGADEESRTRVKCAWCKFKEPAPILTMRTGHFLTMRTMSPIYLYGSLYRKKKNNLEYNSYLGQTYTLM